MIGTASMGINVFSLYSMHLMTVNYNITIYADGKILSGVGTAGDGTVWATSKTKIYFPGYMGSVSVWLTPQGDYIGFCHSEHEDSWSLPGIQATLRRVF